MVAAMHAYPPNQKSATVDVGFETEHTVYEALVTLTCHGCSNAITPGQCFTRRGDKAGTVEGIRYNFCRKCRPIIWNGNL